MFKVVRIDGNWVDVDDETGEIIGPVFTEESTHEKLEEAVLAMDHSRHLDPYGDYRIYDETITEIEPEVIADAARRLGV